MQNMHIEQIRTLINQSPLLNSAERREWLALLALMNETQLKELQNILQGAEPPSVKAEPAKAAATGAPKLSHILNFPQDGKQPAGQNNKNADKPESGFKDRLKTTLAEKELPPGNAVQPHLPAPAKTPAPSAPAAAKNPQAQPWPKSSASAPLSSAAQSYGDGWQKGPKKPLSPTSAFVPGLQNTEVLLNAKLAKKPHSNFEPPRPPVPPPPAYRHAAGEKPAQSKAAADAQGPMQTTSKNKLENLKDLADFTAADFRSYSTKDFLGRLSALMKHSGYHQVIFSLEKSPMFKLYIQTGLALLSESGSFESLGRGAQKSPSETFLSRLEFENFTDALRQVKVLV